MINLEMAIDPNYALYLRVSIISEAQGFLNCILRAPAEVSNFLEAIASLDLGLSQTHSLSQSLTSQLAPRILGI